MLLAGGRAANQERQPDVPALHFPGDKHHLVERGRDEAAQPNQVGPLVDCRLQNAIARHHDAEIDDLITVAAEHHAHDVLSDVVNVAFHRGDDDLPL